MTQEVHRAPDQCPDHPDSKLTISQRSNLKPWALTTERNILTQYQCGENCDKYLGWLYIGPDRTIIQGTGKCENRQAVKAFRLPFDSRKTWHGADTVITAALLILLIALAASAPFTPEWKHLTTAIIICWGAATTAALLTAVRQQARSRRFITLEMKVSGTEVKAPHSQ